MANKKMDSQHAKVLKKTLLSSAKSHNPPIDLSDTGRRWTMWCRTPRPDKIDFIGGAASPAELFAFVAAQRSYMFQTFESAIILEARSHGEFLVREYSCSEG